MTPGEIPPNGKRTIRAYRRAGGGPPVPAMGVLVAATLRFTQIFATKFVAYGFFAEDRT